MGWILTQLVSIIAGLIGELIDFFLGAFTSISLDIGISGTEEIGELFTPSYFTHATGLLDQIFAGGSGDQVEGVGAFCKIFVFMGLVFVLFLGFFKIVQSMTKPNANEAEDAKNVAARIVIAGVCVIYSYSIFTMVESFASIFYRMFQAQFEAIQSSGISLAFGFDEGRLFPDVGALSTLGYSIISIIFFLAMLMQFLRLILECFERYVLLGVLFYTSPLAFSTIATKSSGKIFSAWLEMVISQFLLMMLNMFFISVFYYGYSKILTGDASSTFINTGYIFKSSGEFLATMCIMIGWLTIGQKADQHLRSLGLSVAQTGEGLFRAIKDGVTTAIGTPIALQKIGEKLSKGGMLGRVKKAAQERRIESINTQFASASASGTLVLDGEMTAREYSAGFTRDGSHLTAESLRRAETPTKDKWGNAVKLEKQDAVTAINDNNLAKSDYNKIQVNSAEEVNCSMGKYTATDANKDPIFEAGAKEYYKAHDGEAYRTVTGEASGNEFIIPMTQNDIEYASGHMINNLYSDEQYKGVEWRRDFDASGNPEGTATGYVNGEATYQAALSDVARFDDSYGDISKGYKIKDGDYEYGVQKLSDPARRGYSEVLAPATVKNESYLESKTQSERLDYNHAAEGSKTQTVAKYIRDSNEQVRNAEIGKIEKPTVSLTDKIGKNLVKTQNKLEKNRIENNEK